MFWKLIDPAVNSLFIQVINGQIITSSSFLFWLLVFVGLIMSISIHEFAHAWMAYRLGDDTAKEMDRLTINPINHFDALGLGLILFTFFGYGKPVPVNPNNFNNPVRDLMLVSLAGPMSNFLIAGILGIIFFALRSFVPLETNFTGIFGFFAGLFSTLIYSFPVIGLYNIGLMIFNLLPLYPLDGSKIWGYFNPSVEEFLRVYVYPHSLIIMIAIIFPIFGNISVFQIILFPFIAIYSIVFGVTW